MIILVIRQIVDSVKMSFEELLIRQTEFLANREFGLMLIRQTIFLTNCDREWRGFFIAPSRTPPC